MFKNRSSEEPNLVLGLRRTYVSSSSSQMVNKRYQTSNLAFEKKNSVYFSYVQLKEFHSKSNKLLLQRALNPWLSLCRSFNRCGLEDKAGKASNRTDWMEIFTCKCGCILHNPTTLPCGHTVCKQCFIKAQFCVLCGGTSSPEFHLNVTLGGHLERWFPEQYQSADLKFKARMLIDGAKYQQAKDLISESIKLVGEDSVSLCLRSEANLKLCNTKQAYKDARKSCKLSSQNGEALFILGAACAALNKLDSAVEAYQQCLECNPDDSSLYTKVCQNLDELLSMPLGDEIIVSEDEEEESPKKVDEGAWSCLSSKFDTDYQSEKFSSEPAEVLPSQKTRKRKMSNENITIEKNKEHSKEQSEKDPDDSKLSDTSNTVLPSDNKPSTSYETDSTKSQNSTQKHVSKSEAGGSKDCEKKAKIGSCPTPQLDDFECKLCFNILYQPITTPCGHVFCRICLERCIDHNQTCPICRHELKFDETGVGNITTVIEKAAELYFPKEMNARREKHEEEMKKNSRVGLDEDVEVPIFSCVLVFPTIQSQFHIFEPRYRLMLRECLASGSRRFGICMSNKEGGHSNYGTVVEVKYAKFLPDGRSIVDIVGERRFKVNNSDTTNGIPYAKVKYFEDDLSLCRTDIQREQTMNKCMAVYNQLGDYIGKLHPAERECIFSALGPIPAVDPNPCELIHGESWVWWATAALPLGDKAKFVIFKSQSLLERVTLLHRFLKLLSKVNRSGNGQAAQQAAQT